MGFLAVNLLAEQREIYQNTLLEQKEFLLLKMIGNWTFLRVSQVHV